MHLVMMKEKTSSEFAYDIAIVPPYSFYNALPCGVCFHTLDSNANVVLPVGHEEPIYEASSEATVSLAIKLQRFGESTFTFDPAHLVR